MWTKKEEEHPQHNQRPSSPQANRAPEPQRAAAPQPQPSPATYSSQPVSGSSGAAVIGPSVTIRGDIIANEDLFINGNVEGTVQLDQHRLAVGPRGKVKAQIVAREVMIQGSVEGDIQAGDKIIIKNEGTLVGDIQVAGIVIEDGAYFKGSIDIIRPQQQQQAQAQARQAAAAAPAEKVGAAH